MPASTFTDRAGDAGFIPRRTGHRSVGYASNRLRSPLHRDRPELCNTLQLHEKRARADRPVRQMHGMEDGRMDAVPGAEGQGSA